MNTTHKPQRTNTGDYIYRGQWVMHIKNEWVVNRRFNNGWTRNFYFKSLKGACAYIDKVGE